MIPISLLYGLLLTLSSSYALGEPIQYTAPALAFQSDSNQNIPSLSFETWSDIQNTPAGAGNQPILDQYDRQVEEVHSQGLPPSSDVMRDFAIAFDQNLPILQALQKWAKSFVGSGFLARPPFSPYHHEPIDLSKYTIWEVLNWTLHHPPKRSSARANHELPLYRLAWLANLSDPIREALSNPDADITFFAPDDKALTPPSKRGPHHHHPLGVHAFGDGAEEQVLLDEPDHPFWAAVEFAGDDHQCSHMRKAHLLTTDGDADKEKKKKIFLHIIEMVLKYHISPHQKTFKELLDSSTLPTALQISHDDSAPKFRLRVGASPPFVKPGEVALNFFTRIGGPGSRPIITKNGIIYITRRVPLLPPLSPLSQLFLFPRPFSTLTSAIQKVHLDSLLLPRFGNKTIPLVLETNSAFTSPADDLGDSDLDQVDERVQSILSSLARDQEAKFEKRSFTVFAPTNRAFRSLGPHLNAFLFSPFGAHILRHVLSYHIVPDIIWHSDHIDNVTDFKTVVTRYETAVDLPEEFGLAPKPWVSSDKIEDFHPHFFRPPLGKVNVTEYSLPTLLGSRQNETLKLTVVQYRLLGGKGPISRRVFIKPAPSQEKSIHPPKGVIPVIIPDGVAWGGALHVIPKLIHPPIPASHEGRKDVRRALKLLALSQLHDEM